MPRLDEINLLDKDLARYADVFTQILIYRCRDTLLPELIEVFGKDRLPLFLDIFAGCKFEVPSREIIVNAARDADIYECANRGISYPTLASKHGMADDAVEAAMRRVRKIIEGSDE